MVARSSGCNRTHTIPFTRINIVTVRLITINKNADGKIWQQNIQVFAKANILAFVDASFNG